jgi:hypothetical protein
LERPHRKIVVFSVPYSKLLLVVVERVKLVAGIEILIIFAVAAFNFSVVSGSIWFNELVLNPQLL